MAMAVEDKEYERLLREVESLKKELSDVESEVNTSVQHSGGKTHEKCLLCDIADGKAPSRIIAENADFIAVLEIMPRAHGHVIVISKRHFAHFSDMSVSEMASYTAILKEVITKLRERLYATGYTILSMNGVSSGQLGGHFSTHIVPTYSTRNIDISLINALQPLNVPEAVMESIYHLLK